MLGTIEIVSPSVEVYVHETAQLTLVAIELAAQVAILTGQRAKHFADRGAGEFNAIVFFCVLAQGSWD